MHVKRSLWINCDVWGMLGVWGCIVRGEDTCASSMMTLSRLRMVEGGGWGGRDDAFADCHLRRSPPKADMGWAGDDVNAAAAAAAAGAPAAADAAAAAAAAGGACESDMPSLTELQTTGFQKFIGSSGCGS